MQIIIGILGIIIVILIGIIWKHKRQVDNICRQLEFIKKHESNMLISKEIEWGGIGNLVDDLNELIEEGKQDKREYLEKEKMISDVYTNLSHDIRTPLTSLDGYFQLLETSHNPEEQRRYIGIIQERIESLKEMLEELFTFTKLKNRNFELTLESCSLNRILKETIFSYYEEWKGKGIEPELEIESKPMFTMANAPALKRTFQNIIKNVLDHGDKKITILLKQQGDQGILRFGNKVSGLDMVDLDKVFMKFYKGDPARSKNSTGLGLSIAKEFIERMNGSIGASMEGEWFVITICYELICKNDKGND